MSNKQQRQDRSNARTNEANNRPDDRLPGNNAERRAAAQRAYDKYEAQDTDGAMLEALQRRDWATVILWGQKLDAALSAMVARPAEARPAEARPAEARPAEARPAEARPVKESEQEAPKQEQEQPKVNRL